VGYYRSEQHAGSLDRIARGMEEIGKRKRLDMLMSLSEDDLNSMDPIERDRLKKIRVERARRLITQVESDFGILRQTSQSLSENNKRSSEIGDNTVETEE
jgi:hypothetical protein